MFKRLPVIRHIRYFYLRYKLNCYVINSGALCANQEDIDYLKNVWEGKE